MFSNIKLKKKLIKFFALKTKSKFTRVFAHVSWEAFIATANSVLAITGIVAFATLNVAGTSLAIYFKENHLKNWNFRNEKKTSSYCHKIFFFEMTIFNFLDLTSAGGPPAERLQHFQQKMATSLIHRRIFFFGF